MPIVVPNERKQMTIQGFFNPRTEGDTFKGLNDSIEGTVADRVISDLPTFLREAGRDYYVRKAPAFQKFGDEFAAVANQYHLTRSSDDRVVSPHTVTDQYAPLSLMDISEELQPWCDAGWCSPDGVYEARGGSLELLSLRLDAAGELPEGEQFLHYIVFENPHGSGGTAKGKIISWRIVCANTFAAAVSEKCDFAITHRVASGDHEKQNTIMASRAKDAVAAWEKARQHIATLSDRIQKLTAAKLGFADAKELANRLLDISSDDKASTKAKNRRDAILAAYSMPQFGTRGESAWDFVNAVTFVNSSPLADINKASKVSSLDRLVRNVNTNGTGFKFEARAEQLVAEFIG